MSSEQALADLAYFIESKNAEYQFDAAKVKWIAFGGSYSGSLAAWLREKYPQLVYGSVSTSGPLLAKADFYGMFNFGIRLFFLECNSVPFTFKVILCNFYPSFIPSFVSEYYDVVKNSLATYSADCVNAVQKSIMQVEILLRHMIGQRSLTQKFKYVSFH